MIYLGLYCPRQKQSKQISKMQINIAKNNIVGIMHVAFQGVCVTGSPPSFSGCQLGVCPGGPVCTVCVTPQE